MIKDLHIIKNGKALRCGYTTGSCAAGAAKAAVSMLQSGKVIDYIDIDTPAGIPLILKVNNQYMGENLALCSITKDGGDDPDATDGMEIYASAKRRKDGAIIIDGGEGIGRIMRKGLFGDVGEAAINPVPREMIEKEIREISDWGYDILIYAPEGKAIGLKTFNKNIGIEGGISIIGTKGIVYPMSDDALKKTIYMEVDAIKEKYGKDNIILIPGNHGEKVAESLYKGEPKVKVSNYIGEAISYIYSEGFKTMKLIGHIGKLSKLSIGVFNTHSKICDSRIEAFIYYLALMEAPIMIINRINKCLTAEEALNACIDEGYGEIVNIMARGCENRIKRYLKDDIYPIKVMIFSMERGVFMG